MKEVSIVDDDVLEVLELVDDNDTIEECMMLVNKMSETSLLEIQKEKENLTKLLKEADKEVSKLKHSLRASNSCIEELKRDLTKEKSKADGLEEQVKNCNARIQEMEDYTMQSREEYLEMENKYFENSKLVEDTNRLLNDVLSKKRHYEEQMDSLRKQRDSAQNGVVSLEKRLREEQDRSRGKAVYYEEKLSKTENELKHTKNKLSTSENDFKSHILQLQGSLKIKKGLSSLIAVDAGKCVTAIGEKLDALEKKRLGAEKEKLSLVTKLRELEAAMKDLKEAAEKEQQEKERRLIETENALEEVKKNVHTESLKNAVLLKERDELKQQVKEFEKEKLELQNQMKELEDNYNATKESLANAEGTIERLQEQVTEKENNLDNAHGNGEASAWNNTLNQENGFEAQEGIEPPQNFEAKYNELKVQYDNLSKQFTQIRKHRNEVLRQNNELRHQAQMAVVQLASTNRRFTKHMEQLKMQLNVAERVYQEKLFECNLLEIQVQHLMQQANGNYAVPPGSQPPMN